MGASEGGSPSAVDSTSSRLALLADPPPGFVEVTATEAGSVAEPPRKGCWVGSSVVGSVGRERGLGVVFRFIVVAPRPVVGASEADLLLGLERKNLVGFDVVVESPSASVDFLVVAKVLECLGLEVVLGFVLPGLVGRVDLTAAVVCGCLILDAEPDFRWAFFDLAPDLVGGVVV